MTALLRRFGLDALIVATALESALEVVLRNETTRSPQSPQWFAVPAIMLVVLPLLGHRRFPFAAPLALWIVGTGLSFVDGRLVVFSASTFAAGMASTFLLGDLADPLRARLGLTIALTGAVTVVYHDPLHTAGEFVFIPVLFLIGWLAGDAHRRRRTQADMAEERARHAELERESAVRVAAAEERAGIARELHDIVAHAVSVMVLQVGAVRHKLPDDLTEEAAALTGVERAGRTALTEMRRLLGAMRADGDGVELAPRPGLADLDTLAADVGRAGLPVRLHVVGESFPLPSAIDLSAYRIVQEGLTNALKHARATHADVTVRYAPDELRIEVRDDGRGGAPDAGPGHGLVGVRERVRVYGGDMTANSLPDNGFLLSTRLPLTGGRP